MTANTNWRTTAAANAGIAAETVEEISTPLSIVPRDSAPTTPSPTPMTTITIEVSSTRLAVTPIRCPIRVETLSCRGID